ncbi:hypothetical protein [Streptomyces violascens]|uniref:Uncharacterized protein n=1 Tax=Streptomyces violascens TaxID=67381 RepID=A0ABQ3QXK0_9ACTN|nr:hypothetical protein [Streptomyces violascens]GGU13853.1 hypothetical protein GCM10010289_39560 [Streptomyces violascens]GHI42006.1 hypothetical protein Sviol_64140 [Streptomyces violascens]
MASARIVVHRPRGTGGRRVSADARLLGPAFNDRDLVEILRRAGIDETTAEDWVAGDSSRIEWRGGRPISTSRRNAGHECARRALATA